MSRFIVIGLGNFGLSVARTLISQKHEVLGIDNTSTAVQKARDYLTTVIQADASEKSVLDELSPEEYDGVIVSIGQEMAPSLIISLSLLERKVPQIITRAISDDHVTILKKIGITDVAFPERDMAHRLGVTLSMKNVIDYLPLSDEYAVVEIETPESFHDKSLVELDIRRRFSCQVLGIRYPADGTNQSYTEMAPDPTKTLPPQSVLIVLGREKNVEKMQKSKS